MPASEAQIRASKANGSTSKGPSTPEGKEKSRANSYKHGMTGSGIVLPEREAAEVKRRFAAFADELKPTGEVGKSLALHAARMSVRMERCAEHENAMLTERVRKALAEYEVPEGLDESGIAKLRAEISKQALFDDSKEATLSRKYEGHYLKGRGRLGVRSGQFAWQSRLRLEHMEACFQALSAHLLSYRPPLTLSGLVRPR